VGLFSIFKKKKEFFSPAERELIVEAIRVSEKNTSGEIRVFIESKNPFVDPIDRASEIFFKLKMQETDHRNAVLLYIAMNSHEVALFADEGIYKEVGPVYWNEAVKEMIKEFSENHIVDGMVHCIHKIGTTLTEKFPFIPTEDKNELPDDIVFGK
jgi:uncharacterized membrane protein